MELRPYQREALEAVYRYLRERDGNPLVVLPVGSGKSLVIGQIATDAVHLWNGRVLMVTHSAGKRPADRVAGRAGMTGFACFGGE